MKFNINGKVRVKLTEKGRRALFEAHQAFWATAGQPNRPYHAPARIAMAGLNGSCTR